LETTTASQLPKPPPDNPPLSKAEKDTIKKRARQKKRRENAKKFALSKGIHAESTDEYIHRVRMTSIDTSTPQDITLQNNKRKGSTPNKAQSAKSFKPDLPVLHVYRKDRAPFTMGDRQVVTSAITTKLLKNDLDTALTRTGASRLAGEFLQLEVAETATSTIKELINNLPDFFSIADGEEVSFHSLWGTSSPNFTGIQSLPELIILTADVNLKAEDIRMLRPPAIINERYHFWVQVSSKALDFLHSKDFLIFLGGEPVKLKISRSLYIPSADELESLETTLMTNAATSMQNISLNDNEEDRRTPI